MDQSRMLKMPQKVCFSSFSHLFSFFGGVIWFLPDWETDNYNVM